MARKKSRSCLRCRRCRRCWRCRKCRRCRKDPDVFVVYIRMTGSDITGRGTIGCPYRTMQRALQDIPHLTRSLNLFSTVKRTIRDVLVAAGRSEPEAIVASKASAGLAIAMDKVNGYIKSGKPAEEAYDLAMDDISAWAKKFA